MKKKLLEVREFDSITNKKEDINEYGTHALPAEIFTELETFIHEFASSEDHADALDFMRITYKRHVGDCISLKNYVGLIQMRNGYQIQVLPKISFSN